ncbi:MAG: hypothetical protein K8R53_13325, partial [Bacteroidales bacterium]|nr:hypothetical protein [Bacteroidales bacterium]
IKGKLLKFWEKAWDDSFHNYVMIIDDIDKIHPSSLFGAAIWNYLDNDLYNNTVEGYSFSHDKKKKDAQYIEIPPNFILISVTSAGKSNVININEEHSRRLGKARFFMFPDVSEFYMALKKKFDLQNPLEKKHLKKLLYFFVKANYIIEKKCNINFTVGQWSSIRKKIKPEEFNAYINNFIEQVNDLDPETSLKREDFNEILYSIEHNGKLYQTNIFFRAINLIQSTGLFNEFFAGFLFITISGIAGLLIYNRRKRHIYKAINNANEIFDKYENNQISYSDAEKEIEIQRKLINTLVVKKKINYMEAMYFFNLVNNKMSDQSHVINDFFALINYFIEDKIIDHSEYLQLKSYLNKVNGKIPDNQLKILEIKIEELYKKSSET